MSSPAKEPDKCPIDHSARAKWLEQAQQAREAPQPAAAEPVRKYSFFTPNDARYARTAHDARGVKTRPLANDREVSTIPRADPSLQTATPNATSRPANAEETSSRDATSGNWIYPSEKMFFEAMKRKNYSPNATDMTTIVPIHNAVNERAWKEIKEWENRFAWSREANKSCGGPKLHSFSGDSKKLSPRARWNSLIGYQEPFDRHDWIVERCPGQPHVEYIIDFYSGKGSQHGHPLSFYLDVRPKLNTLEGWKMRVAKFVGW